MSLEQLIQVYAPLAGLLAMAFWVGGLSARVRQLEKDALSHDGILERLARLETNSTNIFVRLESIDRGMQSVQRQFGNLMKAKSIRQFGDET
jgi:hypothetical protein